MPNIDRRLTDLGDRIAELWADISAAKAEWLALVAQFDSEKGVGDTGFASTAHWVAWRCSISATTAREYVRVARRLVDMPGVQAAFARGELSYSKVRALTRVEGGVADELLVRYARAASASQLERIVRSYCAVTVEQAESTFRKRYLDVSQDEDGSVVLRARLAPEDGELFLRALEEAEQRLFAATADGELEPAAARRADAVVWLADTAMASPTAERNGGERCAVTVHVDLETLAGDASAEAPGRSETADGRQLANATVRRLCCDAGLVLTTEREGQTVDVGRRRRTIPPSIRRALQSRDGCCQFPGCGRTRWLDAHHVAHWIDGGETRLSNLLMLCRFHHRRLHEGGLTVAIDGDGWRVFRDGVGRLVPAVAQPPRRGSCRTLTAGRRRRGVSPDGTTVSPQQDDPRWDLGMAVEAMVERREDVRWGP